MALRNWELGFLGAHQERGDVVPPGAVGDVQPVQDLATFLLSCHFCLYKLFINTGLLVIHC